MSPADIVSAERLFGKKVYVVQKVRQTKRGARKSLGEIVAVYWSRQAADRFAANYNAGGKTGTVQVSWWRVV